MVTNGMTNNQFYAWLGSPSIGTTVQYPRQVPVGGQTHDKVTYMGIKPNALMGTVGPNPAGPVTTASCPNMIFGCTDSTAFNYDPSATNNDGSCDYGFRCKQIGNHPKFGSKCVPGNQNNPGPFPTKQDCIFSGCEGLGPGLDRDTSQPCPQTESCAYGFMWDTVTCSCVPDPNPNPDAKMAKPDDEVGRMQDLANIR